QGTHTGAKRARANSYPPQWIAYINAFRSAVIESSPTKGGRAPAFDPSDTWSCITWSFGILAVLVRMNDRVALQILRKAKRHIRDWKRGQPGHDPVADMLR